MRPEQAPSNEPIKELPNKATDMEIALFFANHIENPCETEVEPHKKESMRESYIIQAKNILSSMTEENAKAFLEEEIKKYRPTA